ncbi:MAG: SIS domain-containing protein [Spirochaetota bacterium]
MKQLHLQMLEELYHNGQGVFTKIDEQRLRHIASFVLECPRVFVLGMGHSGMFGRILSMKLNHLGLKAYTVFDEINPPLGQNDLFIAISQSGETTTVTALAQKAKKMGGNVLGITSSPDSTICRISDKSLVIPKVDQNTDFKALGAIGDKTSQNLLGMLFGCNIYILFYALIVILAENRGETPESINSRHQNLQ